jgi:hypothetical protein
MSPVYTSRWNMLQRVEPLLCQLQYLAWEASEQWLISAANRMLRHACGAALTVGSKRASISASYCVRTLYYWFWNVFHQHRLRLRESTRRQQEHRPWLWNVCFLESVLENCRPTLSVWKPPTSFGYQNKWYIHTANISRHCSYLLACAVLIGVHYNYLPFVWNKTGLHSGNKSLCYSKSRQISWKNK